MVKRDDLRRILDDAKGAPDSREVAAPDAQRYSGIVRCTWCGREVREDWTPELLESEPMCARCLGMVRDPDTRSVE